MPRLVSALLACLVLAGCSGEGGDGAHDPAVDRDTLTDRQKDSIVGASRLPGAQGVSGALDAADARSDRNARLDSLQKELEKK